MDDKQCSDETAMNVIVSVSIMFTRMITTLLTLLSRHIMDVLQCTDSEQLVEPEFAGLWDKHQAFKPVRSTSLTADETPRATSCKASKMEKVCFFADFCAVFYVLQIAMFVTYFQPIFGLSVCHVMSNFLAQLAELFI